LLRELGAQLGFRVEVVTGLTLRRRWFSSSEIRRLVESGDVSRAGGCWSARSRSKARWYTGTASARSRPCDVELVTQAEVLPATGVYITRTQDLMGRDGHR